MQRDEFLFPCWRYHPDHEPRVVYSREVWLAMKMEGWKMSPAEFDEEEVEVSEVKAKRKYTRKVAADEHR